MGHMGKGKIVFLSGQCLLTGGVFQKRLTKFSHHPKWCFFCTVHLPSFLFHSSNPNFNQGILFKKPLGSFHLRATITDHRPSLPLRMPLTLPADWELQSPLPNLYCYRGLPLAAQIKRGLLLVEQNCSGSSHWPKNRVAVMQEQYFNKLLEQRDGA